MTAPFCPNGKTKMAQGINFVWPLEFQGHPLVPTYANPDVLVPNAAALRHHFSEWMRTGGALPSSFDAEKRRMAGESYAVLREHGWRPMGIDGQGRIVLAVITDSRPDAAEWHKLDRIPLPSKDEIQSMRADCRRKLREAFPNVEKVTNLEIREEAYY